METVYLKRAWQALTAEQGWWKPVLVLALVQLVPIVGSIIVLGYLYQWGRDAAWGVERGLPRDASRLTLALKTGLIAFLANLFWALVLSTISSLLSEVPGTGGLIAFMFIPFTIVFEMFVAVMVMRATIYASASPLVQFPQAWEMVTANPRGLLRVFGIFCLSILAIFLVMPAAMGLSALGAFGDFSVLLVILSIIAFVPLTFLCSVIVVVANALVLRSLGLWFADFHPETWGASADGLPKADDKNVSAASGFGGTSA